MDFFNELGKKMVVGSKQAVKQTRVFTDTVRINGRISERENVLEIYYSKLGKEYYAIYQEDAEPKFQKVIGDIKNTIKQVEQLKQQIIELKRSWKCLKCGAEISKNALFCPKCGERVSVKENKEVSETAETVFCTNCGSMMYKEQKFCTYCEYMVQAEQDLQQNSISENLDIETRDDYVQDFRQEEKENGIVK